MGMLNAHFFEVWWIEGGSEKGGGGGVDGENLVTTVKGENFKVDSASDATPV
jgi:hypothetical protein